MKQSNFDNAFRTDHEIGFIRNIGTFSETSKGRSRREMLLRYRESIRKRRVWGEINQGLVLAFVDEEIKAAAYRYQSPVPMV